MTLPQNLVRAMRQTVAEYDDLQPEDAPALAAAVEVFRGFLSREDARPVRKVGGGTKARKPADDIPAATRAAVVDRSGGLCEARTPECCGLATQIHHKAGRGWKGCHEVDLLVHVCGLGNTSGCHGWIHADRDRAEAAGLLLPWGPVR